MLPPGLGDAGGNSRLGSFDSGMRSEGSMNEGLLYNGRELLGDRRGQASNLQHGSTGSLDKGASIGHGKARKSRKLLWAALLLLLLVIIAVAVAVPVAITNNNKKSNLASDNQDSTSGTATGTASSASPSATGVDDERSAATGGDGSIVFTEDGSSFIYNNSFGALMPARIRARTRLMISSQVDSGTRSPSTTRRRLRATLLLSAKIVSSFLFDP